MRLKDNADGFWIEFINRRKSPEQFLRQNLIPDAKVMKVLGEEAISSVKGSVKHKIVVKKVANKGVVVHSFSTHGTYPYGILKRQSPNSENYPDLEDATLRHRKWKAKEGIIPSFRGKDFIERETSKHIMDGLKIKSTKETNKSASVTIGWTGENERIANVQDKGGVVTSLWFDKELKTSEIPAHHFIGFQQIFIDNFFDTFKQLI